MTPALFLTCALAMPAVAHTYGAHTLVTDEIAFSRQMLHTERNVLLIGGDPYFVKVFRHFKMRAFGVLTEDRPGATPFHAVGDVLKIPFLSNTFQNVYFNQLNHIYNEDGYKWLLEAIRLVEPAGYFFFDEDQFPLWAGWLYQRAWERLPFRLGQFVIFQKPFHGDHYFRRSA